MSDEEETWEGIDSATEESYNVVDEKCALLTDPDQRRRITTSAVLSEHAYKVIDPLYTRKSAFRRLQKLASCWDLFQLQGSVEIIDCIGPGTKVHPMVMASDADTLYFAFCGTKHLNDFLSDVHMRKRPFPKTPEGSNVHCGFYNRSLRYNSEEMTETIERRLRENTIKKIVFAGHSLGGCIASIKLTQTLLARPEWKNVAMAVTFGAPYWAGKRLSTFLSKEGIAASLHSFFHPCDRIPSTFTSFGFHPVGYYYYTGSSVNRSWAHHQFVKTTKITAHTCDYDEGVLITAALGVLLVSHNAFCNPPNGLVNFTVSPHLKAFSRMGSGVEHQSLKTYSAVSDFENPYFQILRDDPARVLSETDHHGTTMNEMLSNGKALGIYRTAAPSSDFYSPARKITKLWPDAASEINPQMPPPVTFTEMVSGAELTIRTRSHGFAEYLVDGENPRPPMGHVVYQREARRHLMRFPDVGENKFAALPLGDSSTKILKKLVVLFDESGVEHNIPLTEKKTVFTFGASLVSSAASKLQTLVTKAAATFDTVKEPHRVQVFIISYLVNWGHPTRSLPELTATITREQTATTISNEEEDAMDILDDDEEDDPSLRAEAAVVS
eukprot:TRINITY_DN1546_c2_g5_i1.p1 TRINITY_DN1546_c2_g5~~TRINITY_DN1546_c2_g5_i1.p1  ORF type:complete len:629 (+),score=86.01 TRINITY_DN1546_c2_g5_i1:58-1887(+)